MRRIAIVVAGGAGATAAALVSEVGHVNAVGDGDDEGFVDGCDVGPIVGGAWVGGVPPPPPPHADRSNENVAIRAIGCKDRTLDQPPSL